METTMSNGHIYSSVSHYWGMVKDLDDNQKLELVTLLINSMRFSPKNHTVDEQERNRSFRSLSGCWANDSGADDMEAIIREGRKNRAGGRNIPSLDE